ncbi:hypothetical protein [Flavobacterium sp.]|uniref:hypothetical protein n=1 Tax=Flavobacterium sp. TaxID=239 RepID=UPI0026021503|nr:hypothetical protein [Flavobacterium sp.]MDD3004506.1 hypothetical protein [Flavobacterium sp.]
MKREYFLILLIFISVAVIFIFGFFFELEVVFSFISRFIVIWLLIAFYAGQYSMKFPKAF